MLELTVCGSSSLVVILLSDVQYLLGSLLGLLLSEKNELLSVETMGLGVASRTIL